MAKISPEGKKQLDDFIAKETSNGRLPGLTFGVSNLDGEIYFSSSGPRKFEDPQGGGDITPDSVFWVCSQTKLVTAIAALKLIDLGLLSPSTPVSTYLPEFATAVIVDDTSGGITPTYHPASKPVLVEHLMNFTSGLFYHVVKDDPMGMPLEYRNREMHDVNVNKGDTGRAFARVVMGDLPGMPLKFEPGTDFTYGLSSDVLGFVIEKVSGKSLGDFCEEHIFAPLGIKASFRLTPELKSKLVSLVYRQQDGSRRLETWNGQMDLMEQDPDKVTVHLGGVGLYTSMRDYLTLLRHIMQLNAGRSVPNAILKTKTAQSIFIPQLSPTAEASITAFVDMSGLTKMLGVDKTPVISWSNALAVCTESWERRRNAGTVFWGGWAGTLGAMDPKAGIAFVFGTQILPPFTTEAVTANATIETLLYAALEPSLNPRETN